MDFGKGPPRETSGKICQEEEFKGKVLWINTTRELMKLLVKRVSPAIFELIGRVSIHINRS